jgi:hypothetical protein
MPAGQETGYGQPDGVLLSDNNFTNLRDQRLDPAFHGGSGNVGRVVGIVECEKTAERGNSGFFRSKRSEELGNGFRLDRPAHRQCLDSDQNSSKANFDCGEHKPIRSWFQCHDNDFARDRSTF